MSCEMKEYYVLYNMIELNMWMNWLVYVPYKLRNEWAINSNNSIREWDEIDR